MGRDKILVTEIRGMGN